MNLKKFSDAMSEHDDKYVDEALYYSKGISRPRRYRRMSVALASVALAILLTSAVVAAGMFGTRIVEFFTSHTESGFDLGITIKKMQMDDFSEDVHEIGEIIQQQFKNYKAHDSWYPGERQTVFSTRNEACEYIGFDKLKRLYVHGRIYCRSGNFI